MSKIKVNELDTRSGTTITVAAGKTIAGTDIIDTTQIATDAITSTELADNAVDTNAIADNQVTLAKMAGLARGKLIVGDASGDPSALTVGTSGQYLTSDGTDASWGAVVSLPSQTSKDGYTLITDGTNASWSSGPHRNMIINGAMQIHQRGTTAAGGATNIYTPLDRWQLVQGSSFDFDVTATINSTTVNTSKGFQTALTITPDSTKTPTGSENGTIAYRLEGFDCQRLQQGGADAHTFTLSFYAKAVNKTGIYSVCCIKKDAGGSGRYQVKEFTLTTSWVRQEITFEADTTALIRNSNAGDLNFYFNMTSGPDDLVAPTTAWVAGGGIAASTNQVNFMDSTSNEFHMTGVQLEIGSVATPYDHRTFGQELAACQRYYEKSYGINVTPGATNDKNGTYRPRHPSAGTNGVNIWFKVTKRAVPTIVFYAAVSGNTGKITNMSGGASDITCSTESYVGESEVVANYTSTGGETNVEGHWTAESEL